MTRQRRSKQSVSSEDRERALYQAALDLERDERLTAEMAEWNATIGDWDGDITPDRADPP